MKIELKSAETRFEDVKRGETFVYEGILYQRSDQNGSGYASIRLCDGITSHFYEEDRVRLVKGTFRED